jgi:hypothetical protein
VSTYNVNQEDRFIQENSGNGRPERVSFLDVFARIVGFETSLFPHTYGCWGKYTGQDNAMEAKATQEHKNGMYHHKK